MTPEYLIFHNVAHMSYHFSHGGLGVRPYIDLYLLRSMFLKQIHSDLSHRQISGENEQSEPEDQAEIKALEERKQ